MRSSSAQLIDTDHINMVTKKMTHKATANRRDLCERVYYDQLHYLFISLIDVVQTSVKLKQKKKKKNAKINTPKQYSHRDYCLVSIVLWYYPEYVLIKVSVKSCHFQSDYKIIYATYAIIKLITPTHKYNPVYKDYQTQASSFRRFLDVCLCAAGRFLVSAFRTNSHGIWCCVTSFSPDVPPILLTCLFWVSSIGGTHARLMSLFMYVMTRAWLAVSAKSISSLRSGQKV